jgi:Icc-related predicted phosphoesterase
MIIIALSDIHGCLDHLGGIAGDIAGADLVLVSGDITNFGGRSQAEKVVCGLRQYDTPVFLVPGNCDTPDVDKYLREEKIDLNCNLINVAGFNLVGIGGSLPCPRHTPNESPEEDFAVCLEHLKEMIGAKDKVIFVCHHPAKDTVVDFTGSGHSGSTSVRDFIESSQPILALSGHIHDAPGVDHIGKTTLVNPGPMQRGCYGYIEISEDGRVGTVELRNG